MLRKVRTVFGFNKALADVGLGSHGLTANVHSELRRDLIFACLQDNVAPKLAAAKLFITFNALGMISPSHERTAQIRLDRWAADQRIPDPFDLKENMVAIFEGRRKPTDMVEAICQHVHRFGSHIG